MIRLIFSLYFLFFPLTNYSVEGWDPDRFHLPEINQLQETDYLILKSSVTDYLQGSWCSKDKAELLMDLVLLTKPKFCVEIGVFTGSSLLPVAAALKYNKQGKIYAIDAWSNEVAIRHMSETDPNRSWWSLLDMSTIKGQFERMLVEWRVKKNCEILSLTSKDAVEKIHMPIDYLHIDGDYAASAFLEDIDLYVPKVKKGGYILLSNLFLTVHNRQPKRSGFNELLKQSDVISVIDDGNTVLLRKK
jgi:hypothetical protein